MGCAAVSGTSDALSTGLPRIRRPVSLAAGLIAAFLLVPVVVVAAVSFTSAKQMTFPPEGFSLQWYSEVLTEDSWRSAFLLSLRVALLAATFATVIGTLAALGVRRLRRGAFWLRSFFVAPIVFPVVAYAIGLYFSFSEVNLVGNWLVLGVSVGTLGMPLAFVIVSGALAKVPLNMSTAAASLGASWPLTVWRVELALVRPAIIVSWLVVLVYAFDEFVIALYLTAPDSPTFPLEIYKSATSLISPAIAAAATLLMVGAIAVSGLGAAVLRLLDREARA